MTATVRDEIVRRAVAWVKAAGDVGAARWTKPMGDHRPDYTAIRNRAETAFRTYVDTALAKPDAGKTAETVWRQLSCFKDDKCRQHPCPCFDAIATALAQAVAGEREACAKVADTVRSGWFNGEATTAYGQAFQQACKDIAASIRARNTQADGEKNG